MATLRNLILPGLLALAAGVSAQKPTFAPGNLPNQTETGQSGYNICSSDSQSSGCQTAWMNGIDDFCLWGPPEPNSLIGNIERIAVAYCTKPGHGTRLLPNGALKLAHWVQTPDYVQVTGLGDFTLIGIAQGDSGGEMDPHGADGNGNPIGGLIFSNVWQQGQQIHEWTNFMSYDQFCLRACRPGPRATQLCEHIYDIEGCGWNIPGDYNTTSFDSCLGDSTQPMGIYSVGGTLSTWTRSASPVPPPAHPAGATSSCTTVSSLGNSVSPIGTSTPTTTSAAVTNNGASSTNRGPSAAGAASPSATGSSGAAALDVSQGLLGVAAAGAAGFIGLLAAL